MVLRKANLLGFAPTHGHSSTRPLPFSQTGTALIVANLPYIPTTMRTKLAPCLKREPASALFSGTDGLDASRALVDQLVALTKKLPNKNIILIFEILAAQFVPLAAYIAKKFPGTKSLRIKNYQGVTVGLRANIVK
jgi:methylase of polypeptide subunit release factors